MSVREQVLNLTNSSRSSTVIWNNRHILIDGKSVFYQSLFDKEIVTLENLVTDTNVLLVRQDQEGGSVSRVNIGRLITTSVTSRHTSMFFKMAGNFLVRHFCKR